MPTKTILIIEDEPVHLQVMQEKLEREGYRTISATDGKTGLMMVRSEKPDAVLLDILLPQMDGFEVLEALKTEGNKTPVIVVSNSGQPVEIDRAMELGAKDYLVKAQFNPSDVLEKVHQLFGDAAVAQGAPAAPSGTPTGPAQILIIEDDKFLRDLIGEKLKREGFGILNAVDGEEGMKIAKEQSPRLVLLDLILPGLDGFEVLHQLKTSASTKSIPVIVLSNLGQKEDMDKALGAGAEDFMVKAHFTPSEIVDKIKSTLRERYL